MWRQIKLTDEDIDIKILQVVTIMKSMHQWYEDNLTVDSLKIALVNKAPSNIQLWLYESESYEIVLCTKHLLPDTIYVYKLGIGKWINMDTAVRLAHEKLIAICREASITHIKGLWNSESFYKGFVFYDLYTDNSIAISDGIGGTINEFRPPNSYETSAWL